MALSSLEATSDLWWKNAVIYCVDTQSFQDTNGDGVGDLDGLTQRIDYLAGLGVTCLWLMPIYPSPERDYGYDVADYYGVGRKYGSLGDLVELVRTARERGIRVIADLVVNHTSIEHPWFQAARRDRNSLYHDYYVWADEKPNDAARGRDLPRQAAHDVVLRQASARRWYMHRFYPHQPDLNINNPIVRDEIHKVIGFWLELGLSGFRVDAVPFLIEQVGSKNAAVRDPHDYLRDLPLVHDPPPRRCDAAGRGERAGQQAGQVLRRPRQPDAHAVQLPRRTRRCTCRSCAATRRPRSMRCDRCRRSRRPAQWANFVKNHDEASVRQADRHGARGDLRRVRARRSRCGCTTAASAAASRRWSTATAGGWS